MKKVLIVLLIALLVATPCYALNVFEKFLYIEVVLKANKKHILANRITNQVKYMLQDDGHWTLVTGALKGQLQGMYDYQRTLQQ